ncbi:P1 family peptidase [Gordonia sp. CPCC 205333]|uniref:P1 family peptidase n=1 Tax=Gordonia sp. CPCC 205333 TaxID=3140790 RepID=UPI003AF3C5B1
MSVAGRRISDVEGVGVGHYERIDDDATVGEEAPGSGWASGTTVVTLPPGSVTAVDVRGGGPGTRETDLLDPVNTVIGAHAIVLSGGSAYGLAAADGVMLALEAKGIGLPMDSLGHVVPIVPAAVIFDLLVGDWAKRPDVDFGARALGDASVDFAVGSVGGGTGARAGCLKGGVGTASITLNDGPASGVTVGALVVANPVGDVLDLSTGLPWGASKSVLSRFGLQPPSAKDVAVLGQLSAKQTVLNTTIGVVAVDAKLDVASTKRIAMAAHDGLARAIRPAHSPLDGDTLFAVATGRIETERSPRVPPGMNPDVALVAALGAAAADMVADAIVDAVVNATSVAGLPTMRQVLPSAFG